MGVLPLQFPDGQSADSLGLTGEEVFSIEGMAEAMSNDGPSTSPAAGAPSEVQVLAQSDDPARPEPVRFAARVRIDTPREAEYFRHGGILQFVLRHLLST
jgi:aconitate hydratase